MLVYYYSLTDFIAHSTTRQSKMLLIMLLIMPLSWCTLGHIKKA